MERIVGAHSINLLFTSIFVEFRFVPVPAPLSGLPATLALRPNPNFSLLFRTDMLQRRNLRSRSVGDSRHAGSGALSRRSVVGYSGGLRMIGIGPEDDDAC